MASTRTSRPLLAQVARYGIIIFAIVTALSFLGVPNTSIYRGARRRGPRDRAGAAEHARQHRGRHHADLAAGRSRSASTSSATASRASWSRSGCSARGSARPAGSTSSRRTSSSGTAPSPTTAASRAGASTSTSRCPTPSTSRRPAGRCWRSPPRDKRVLVDPAADRARRELCRRQDHAAAARLGADARTTSTTLRDLTEEAKIAINRELAERSGRQGRGRTWPPIRTRKVRASGRRT